MKTQQALRRLRLLTTFFVAILVCAASPLVAQDDPWQHEGDGQAIDGLPIIEGGMTVGPITFAEAEFPTMTVMDGLVVSTLDGAALPAPLSFGFTVGGLPSVDAAVGFGPGTTLYIDDPSVEGDATGTFSIDFGTPVDQVEFGIALSCPPPVTDAVTIDAFLGGNNVGSGTVDGIDTGFFFAENLAQFGGVVFDRFELTYNSVGCPRFVIDNLSYNVAPPQDPVIDVPTLGAIGLGLLALLLVFGAAWVMRRNAA